MLQCHVPMSGGHGAVSPRRWVSSLGAPWAPAANAVGRRGAAERWGRQVHAARASTTHSQPPAADCSALQQPAWAGSRRQLLAAATAAPLAAAAAARAEESTPQELRVGPGQEHATIGSAVAAAAPGAVIRVAPGRYLERLILTQPVTIIGDEDDPGVTELVWETTEPYQPVVFCAADGIVVRGFTIRHRSPSIANNYAVQMQDCNAALDACDVSSATGSGVGSEGGSPQIYRCTVHDCARHGIAVFGGLDGSRASAVIEACEVRFNKGHGLLVRDGATPAVTDSSMFRNGGFGMMLQDCGGSYSRNVIKENIEGAVGHLLLFEDFDVNDLVVENKLDRYPQKLTPLRK